MAFTRFCFIFIVGCISLVQADQNPQQNIRIIADEWPPITGSELAHGGFSVQLATEALHALGYSVSVEFAPWKRILRTSKRGEYDLITAMWKSKERESQFQFTKTFYANNVVFVSLTSQSFQYSNPSDLTGKRVGIVSSYAYPEKLLATPSVIWVAGMDLNQNLKKVLGGRLDMAIGAENVMRYEAKQLEGADRLFYDTAHPLEVRSVHMGVNRQYKHHQKLAKELDHMIQTFKQSGRFDQIKKQHGLM